MCTVTYIPQKNGYILSSNRDESPSRAENNLTVENTEDVRILFPKDTKGGSWLIASDTGRAACLLNGAFEKHTHQPPYRMSRGLVLKAIFKYPDLARFLREFGLIGIEPFTLIVTDNLGLTEVRWNGKTKFARKLNNRKSYIWSSSTLYTPQMQEERSHWFDKLNTESQQNLLSKIKNIHRTGGKGNTDYGYIMNRENRVATISITHLVVDKKHIKMEFENLIHPEIQVRRLERMDSVNS